MIYQLSIFSDIGFSIEQAIRSLTGKIAADLYNLIIYLYNLFLIIARAQILDNKYIQGVYTRVGMILGLFMIFKLLFVLIQTLVDPDKMSEKKNNPGKIIMRCIISVVLLGVTPSIFKFAYSFQNVIVGGVSNSNNIIYRIIVADDEVEDAASFGNTLAADLYFSFFRESEEGILNEGIEIVDNDGEEVLQVKNYQYLKSSIKDGSMDFDDLVHYLSLREGGRYVIKWDIVFSLIIAVIIIWILISYCISVALRVIQLSFLQLIAPIPILSYINDSEGTFKKWTTQCLVTYSDLFIRVAIIYFVITLSGKILSVLEDQTTLAASTGMSQDQPEYIWVKIFLLLGLLMFAKKVPDLIKELFPSIKSAASLGFGIKSPKKTLADIPLAGGAANKVLGYAGNVGKKAGKWAWAHTVPAAGKWAWAHTGGKISDVYHQYKEDQKHYKEEKEQDNLATKTFDKYYDENTGEIDYNKAFDNNKEYINSFNAVNSAKDALKKASQYGRDSAEYMKAERDLEAAKKNHEINRSKYGKLKRVEDNIKRAKDRGLRTEGGNTSSNPQSSQNSNNGSPMANAQANANTAQRNTNTAPTNTGTWSQGPYVSPQQAEDNAYNEMIDAVNNGSSEEEINSKIDAYNKASQKRQQVDNDIDDFYDRQNDGFGGQ